MAVNFGFLDRSHYFLRSSKTKANVKDYTRLHTRMRRHRHRPYSTYKPWGGVTLSPLCTSVYQPQMIDDECEAVDGKRIGRGNWNAGTKPDPVPLCPPQIPHDLTWVRTRAAAVGSRRLTAWVMARPYKPYVCPHEMSCCSKEQPNVSEKYIASIFRVEE
jgi:hypothetical protein